MKIENIKLITYLYKRETRETFNNEMDFKNSLDFRTGNIKNYNNKAFNGYYDYASYGILSKCLPKILFKGNPVLVSFLQLIDIKIIMLLKTTIS